MKKGIHPKYESVKMIKTTGEIFEVRTCLSAKYADYHLEVDPEAHPAWSGKNRFSGPAIGNVKKMEKRYPGLG